MCSNKVIEIDSGKVTVPENKFTTKAAEVNAAIQRLSALSSLEYNLCRKNEAKELGLKVDTLDAYVKKGHQDRINAQMQYENDAAMFPQVVAWHEAVAVGEVLDEIEVIIKRYTVLDNQYAAAIALWVAFSWLHNKATVSPILNLTSPEKRCGKSTLLDVIESLVRRPLPSGNITPAALFRSIEKWSPTLVIDEADTFLSNSDDMKGIINSGHYKSKAFVIRCDGEDNTPVSFTTWCPKVIAGIGSLAETIMDRSIIVVMKRKLSSQPVESIRHKSEDEFEILRQKLKRWSQDTADDFKRFRPERIEGVNDRANDNWEPLLAIACIAGDEWSQKACQAVIPPLLTACLSRGLSSL